MSLTHTYSPHAHPRR